MSIDTHHVVLTFGKHKGELLTRVPISYVRWMSNNSGQDPAWARWRELAKAEHDRRGSTYPTIELSGHAIDNASLRIRKIWHTTSNEHEGLYSWLARMSSEAILNGLCAESENDDVRCYHYKGVKFVIAVGDEYPVLKTVMPSRVSRTVAIGDKV